MLKVLVPVGGSEDTNRLLDHLAKLKGLGGEVDIHLLNVQFAIDGHARSFVSPEELENYHREEGLAALAPVRAALDAAGLPYTRHIAVGHVADTILRFAQEHGFDKIVMCTRGRGAVMQALLGSVAHEVLERSPIPVTLVKPGEAA